MSNHRGLNNHYYHNRLFRTDKIRARHYPLSAFLAAVLLALAVPVRGLPLVGCAQSGSPAVNEIIPLRLPKGKAYESWEYAFEVPKNDRALGWSFTERQVFTTGNLEIKSEAMTRTWYRLRIVIRKRPDGHPAKGRLFVRLWTGTPVPDKRLPPPRRVAFSKGSNPLAIKWEGEGSTLAIRLLELTSGEIIREGIVPKRCPSRLPPSALAFGGHYLLEAAQSDKLARYSRPSKIWFRVDSRNIPCRTCKGSGWLGDKPEPVREAMQRSFRLIRFSPRRSRPGRCPYCKGSGVRALLYPTREEPEPASAF